MDETERELMRLLREAEALIEAQRQAIVKKNEKLDDLTNRVLALEVSSTTGEAWKTLRGHFNLAVRAVKCLEWRWIPGMRVCLYQGSTGRLLVDEEGEGSEDYVVRAGPDGNELQCIQEVAVVGPFPWTSQEPLYLPDLRDHATLGCLEALVGEVCDAYGRSFEIASGTQGPGGWWRVEFGGCDVVHRWTNEDTPCCAMALVSVLELVAKRRVE